MPKIVSFDINLAPKDPFFETALGKILKWALSVGRYIVIFTEIVVIMSFVSRFTLDRQITDLNNSINQKQSVIQSFGDLETNVRTAQRLVDEYKQVEQSSAILGTFPALTQVTPQGISLRQLIIRSNQISVTGTTFSQDTLNTLINNITVSPFFTDVEVTKIETDPQQKNSFSFAIGAQLKSME